MKWYEISIALVIILFFFDALGLTGFSNVFHLSSCGKLHKESKVYGAAKAEQVVRARYSAYAKREIDFIIGSTHPLNKAFMTDIEHWRETIGEKLESM